MFFNPATGIQAALIRFVSITHFIKRQLAEIALQWMLQRAEHAGLQLIKDHEPATAPDPTGPIHEPWNTWPGRALRWLHLGNRPREVPPEALYASAEARHRALGYRPELFAR